MTTAAAPNSTPTPDAREAPASVDATAAPRPASFGARAFTRMFAAFTYRDFRVQWFGACTSSIGTWMQIVAQNWLVLSLTHSAFFLGLDAFLQHLFGPRLQRHLLEIGRQVQQVLHRVGGQPEPLQIDLAVGGAARRRFHVHLAVGQPRHVLHRPVFPLRRYRRGSQPGQSKPGGGTGRRARGESECHHRTVSPGRHSSANRRADGDADRTGAIGRPVRICQTHAASCTVRASGPA